MSETQLAEHRPIERNRRALPKRKGSLFLFTPSDEPCGVEVFTRELASALGANDGDAYGVLAISGRWSAIPATLGRIIRANRVVFSLPLNAWKQMLLVPIVLLLLSVLARRRVSVVLHEWAALHWLRRAIFVPFIALGDSIVILSPFIRDQIANDPIIGWAVRKCSLIPHPPTVRRPSTLTVTDMVRRVERLGEASDIVIGYFGAIYKGKAPIALLEICDHLHSCGIRASVVFIGSFTKSLDNYDELFRKRVKELNLDNHVIVTGYIEGESELFALFERIGVFLFQFPEGLTARRSSVIACLQSGRPVVVSAPQTPAEFEHHSGFKALIASGALSFVPRQGSVVEISDALRAAAIQTSNKAPTFDGDAWWNATKDAARALL